MFKMNRIIPRKHKMCTIERPGWFRELLGKESPQKDFVILDNEVVDAETFIKLLKDRFADSEQNDVLLFVHGYNISKRSNQPNHTRRPRHRQIDLYKSDLDKNKKGTAQYHALCLG